MRLFLLFLLLLFGELSAQNVGIGTVSPQQRLHVAGQIRVGTGSTYYDLPAADGDEWDVLATDGNGNAYWQRRPRVETFRCFMDNADETVVDANWVRVHTKGVNPELRITNTGTITLRVTYMLGNNAPVVTNVAAGAFVDLVGLSSTLVQITIARFSTTQDVKVMNILATGMTNGWLCGNIIWDDF